MTQLLLVHSPAVGPATWAWVADALRQRGHTVWVPDLVAASLSGDPDAIVRDAAGGVEGPIGEVVVVGHSGAGPLLPAIAAAVGARVARLVFVDAGLPPRDGARPLAGSFLPVLQQLAHEGLLPPWSTWFGSGTLERLIADPDRRDRVRGEIPTLPLSLYAAPIDPPADWWTMPAGYVQLSEPYADDAATAARLGWPVIVRSGGHLDIVGDPEGIATALLELVSPE